MQQIEFHLRVDSGSAFAVEAFLVYSAFAYQESTSFGQPSVEEEQATIVVEVDQNC